MNYSTWNYICKLFLCRFDCGAASPDGQQLWAVRGSLAAFRLGELGHKLAGINPWFQNRVFSSMTSFTHCLWTSFTLPRKRKFARRYRADCGSRFPTLFAKSAKRMGHGATKRKRRSPSATLRAGFRLPFVRRGGRRVAEDDSFVVVQSFGPDRLSFIS